MEKLNCEPAVALKEEKNFIQFSEKYLQRDIFQLQTVFINSYENKFEETNNIHI